MGHQNVVEHALLKKVEDFPKLTNKDNAKLVRELGDILQEIECAKECEYLPGLSYLVTRGVNPIVEKLTHSLQEKWIAWDPNIKRIMELHFPLSVFFKAL